MAAQSEIRIRCQPPHREFFVVIAFACTSIGVWMFVSAESTRFLEICIWLLILIATSTIIWLLGLYVPNRGREYEVTDSEIRIIRDGARLDTIPFSSILHFRSLGRSLIISRAGASSVHIYPGSEGAQIRGRLEEITTSEQA